MAELGESSFCSDKSLPCYSLDEQLLRILWDQDIGMNELLEFSFDRIDRLAETCGMEVSMEQKQELWSYVQRMQMEKSDWLSPSKVSADRPRTYGSWEDSIGPPPPSPVFGFANDSPVESSPRSPSRAAKAVTSPGAGSSTPRPDAIREGQGHTPRSHRSMLRPSLLKLSPIGAPGARSSKRPIGQKIKSFFTGTVSWKVPHDQRLARRDHKSKLRVPSSLLRLGSSSVFGALHDRIPALFRKSLRLRSGTYVVNRRLRGRPSPKC
ncbi:hypothetical protein ISCGN_009250 [Ixodes scapularis]